MAVMNSELNTDDLQARVQQISEEARALGSTLETTITDIEQTLRTQVEQRPLAMLAAAAGVGYVLGGGLPSRLTTLLFGIGSRFVMDAAIRDVTQRLAAGAKR